MRGFELPIRAPNMRGKLDNEYLLARFHGTKLSISTKGDDTTTLGWGESILVASLSGVDL